MWRQGTWAPATPPVPPQSGGDEHAYTQRGWRIARRVYSLLQRSAGRRPHRSSEEVPARCSRPPVHSSRRCRQGVGKQQASCAHNVAQQAARWHTCVPRTRRTLGQGRSMPGHLQAWYAQWTRLVCRPLRLARLQVAQGSSMRWTAACAACSCHRGRRFDDRPLLPTSGRYRCIILFRVVLLILPHVPGPLIAARQPLPSGCLGCCGRLARQGGRLSKRGVHSALLCAVVERLPHRQVMARSGGGAAHFTWSVRARPCRSVFGAWHD